MSVWTGLDLFIKSTTSLMSLVVSYRQEIYKGKEMDYKRISTGFVPVCRNCGNHLGVICDSEDEARKYSVSHPYCAACLESNSEVQLAAESMKSEAEKQDEVKHEAYCQHLDERTDKFLQTLHDASFMYHNRDEIACYTGYSYFGAILQRLGRLGYKKMFEEVQDNGMVRLVYQCNLLDIKDELVFTLKGYRGNSGGAVRKIPPYKYREVLDFIIENGIMAATERYGYDKCSYRCFYPILECCGFKYWNPGRYRSGLWYKGDTVILPRNTDANRLMAEFNKWKQQNGRGDNGRQEERVYDT